MSNKEPTIIANGYSEEQIVEWMRGKLSRIDRLKEAQMCRQEMLSALDLHDKRINSLAAGATLKIEDQN